MDRSCGVPHVVIFRYTCPENAMRSIRRSGSQLIRSINYIPTQAVSAEPLVLGQNFTVTLTAYNRGNIDARSVDIIDAKYDPNVFTILNGASSIMSEFDVVEPGENATFSFELVATRLGVYTLTPAVVTYRASDGEQKTRGTSNDVENLWCVTEMDKSFERVFRIGAYLTLGLARNAEEWKKGAKITTGVLSLLTVNYVLLLLKQFRKEWERRRAIVSLTKSD
uniref:Translocon-associated protein subunit beta n=1 Tax=Micromonas pusilla TaxID=38833 RepID=A0A7R9TIY6_MICPS|mmetsp:Transcript_2529/g.8107  ORF Transcript_2529/g.8107 Transcript_2529/m.8107 type:complete len:223 (+) Transcript_2529:336-1004(+)|eukprot:31223-Pelagococcus_subviridis.AAC.2